MAVGTTEYVTIPFTFTPLVKVCWIADPLLADCPVTLPTGITEPIVQAKVDPDTFEFNWIFVCVWLQIASVNGVNVTFGIGFTVIGTDMAVPLHKLACGVIL